MRLAGDGTRAEQAPVGRHVFYLPASIGGVRVAFELGRGETDRDGLGCGWCLIVREVRFSQADGDMSQGFAHSGGQGRVCIKTLFCLAPLVVFVYPVRIPSLFFFLLFLFFL